MNNHALVPSRRCPLFACPCGDSIVRRGGEEDLDCADSSSKALESPAEIRRDSHLRGREERRKWARTRGPRNIKLDFLVVVGGVSATATYR